MRIRSLSPKESVPTTSQEFSGVFQHVFDTLIPAEARDAIGKYWKAFGVSSKLFLSDAQIEKANGLGKVPVAAVFGGGCLHRFAFREFVVEHAPEECGAIDHPA